VSRHTSRRSGPTYEDVLRDLDANVLAPRVREAVGREAAVVEDWSFERLDGGVSELSGNAHYRLSGTGRDGSDTFSWSLVLKIHNLGDVETTAERESDCEIGFYRSDVATGEMGGSGGVGGFRPVRCLDVQLVEAPESCWLWLADVDGAFDGTWPLAQFERTARHLGQFNGAFAGEVPDREWIRPYGFDHGSAAPVVAALDELPDHPGLERGLPPAVRDPLRRVWAERDRLRDLQASLPRTFCHFDPTPGNLFACQTDDGWETVAIDWEFCGEGPLGADAALLVAASPVAGHTDVDRLPELDDRVFDAYLDGLRDTGWNGDADLVRAGYATVTLTHWLESIGEVREPYLDPGTAEVFQELFGISREAWLSTMGERARFLAGKVEQAFDALDTVECWGE